MSGKIRVPVVPEASAEEKAQFDLRVRTALVIRIQHKGGTFEDSFHIEDCGFKSGNTVLEELSRLHRKVVALLCPQLFHAGWMPHIGMVLTAVVKDGHPLLQLDDGVMDTRLSLKEDGEGKQGSVHQVYLGCICPAFPTRAAEFTHLNKKMKDLNLTDKVSLLRLDVNNVDQILVTDGHKPKFGSLDKDKFISWPGDGSAKLPRPAGQVAAPPLAQSTCTIA